MKSGLRMRPRLPLAAVAYPGTRESVSAVAAARASRGDPRRGHVAQHRGAARYDQGGGVRTRRRTDPADDRGARRTRARCSRGWAWARHQGCTRSPPSRRAPRPPPNRRQTAAPSNTTAIDVSRLTPGRYWEMCAPERWSRIQSRVRRAHVRRSGCAVKAACHQGEEGDSPGERSSTHVARPAA